MKTFLPMSIIALLLAGCTTNSGSLFDIFAPYEECPKVSSYGRKVENRAPVVRHQVVQEPVYENVVVQESAAPVVAPTPLEETTVNVAPVAVVPADARPCDKTKGVATELNHDFAMKDHGEDFVTYEYRNISINELSGYAVEYCADQGGREASLREIILWHNHHRRATFDCKYLAKEETAPYIDL